MFAGKVVSNSNQQPKVFLGVRFVLFGFDSLNEHQVRSKLVCGGGVDVGQYSQDCTHVIADKLIYDDPACVAARKDGKTLVTGLWVDHSFDIGMPVDHTSIMYRPRKDLNGIPGAKGLIMCLTGYQRQDRDDIMTMVGLIGAQFSKPLVANKVTHLICYKFEGEKYELAKKMKTIKLVNHKWLEDCLTAWELLPEANYSKSGYELEIENEAKDSEEEAEDSFSIQFRARNMNLSPHSSRIGMPRANELPESVGKVSKIALDTVVASGSSNVGDYKEIPVTNIIETSSGLASSLNNVNEKNPEVLHQNSTSAELGGQHDRTPVSTKVVNGLASTSGSARKSPHSDVGKSSISYSYSRKNGRSPSFQGEIPSNLSNSPKVKLGEQKNSESLNISTSKAEQVMARNSSTGVKVPLKESGEVHEEFTDVLLPQKREMDASCARSKSQKKGHDSIPSMSRSLTNEIQELEPIAHSPVGIEEAFAVNSNLHPVVDAVLNSAENLPADIFQSKSSSFNGKLPALNMSVSKNVASGIGKDSNTTSFERLEESVVNFKPATVDITLGGSEQEVGRIGEFQNQQKYVDASSPDNRARALELEKSHSPAQSNFLGGEHGSSLSRPLKRTVGKKSLGSRPKLGASSSANKKGSIYLDRPTCPNDTAACPAEGRELASTESPSRNKLEVAFCLNKTESVVEKMTENLSKSGNNLNDMIEFMDDDTEAPDDKEENELEKVEVTIKPDILIEERSVSGQQTTDNNKTSIDCGLTLEGSKSGPDQGKAAEGKKVELGESTNRTDVVTPKITKRKKRPFARSKIHTVCAAMDDKESETTVGGDETGTDNIFERSNLEEERGPYHANRAHTNSLNVNKLENTMGLEKENDPMTIGNKSTGGNEQHVGKAAAKSDKMPAKTNKRTSKVDPNSVQVGRVQNETKAEPRWFILSGHRIQRKEFQKILRHLKGRICRDSHQWSYQATHFIAPDPIRRTEKFFAAAASGRWILNTDYLTASSQAGKLMAEEPYEWHKNGLSEDGAINLEAPRKWRLLREKTGHGAFYGMRVIIYGECIAPPLDTLKRVVKAGDGTILATSPPYNRFLDSGVDFAIVSPGMPVVDMWVQEFLRHEVPCIVPDYLVEYVCKPGYSLEKHVQYNTHAWAEKSFSKLQSRSEEIVEDLKPSNDHDLNDLTCRVCGSSDRGVVMLICGDEGGSVGCGVGTHIDCCEPPLEEVPEEDWFCPKCSRSKNSSIPSKKNRRKKASSKSR